MINFDSLLLKWAMSIQASLNSNLKNKNIKNPHSVIKEKDE